MTIKVEIKDDHNWKKSPQICKKSWSNYIFEHQPKFSFFELDWANVWKTLNYWHFSLQNDLFLRLDICWSTTCTSNIVRSLKVNNFFFEIFSNHKKPYWGLYTKIYKKYQNYHKFQNVHAIFDGAVLDKIFYDYFNTSISFEFE
jgi:hypothetical protein